MSFPSASPEELNIFPASNNSPNDPPLPTNLAATLPRHAAAEPPELELSQLCDLPPQESPLQQEVTMFELYQSRHRLHLSPSRPCTAEIEASTGRRTAFTVASGGGNTEGASTSTQAPSSTTGSSTSRSEPTASTSASTESQNQAGGGRVCPFEETDPKKLATNKFENEFGRLVIDEGRSRYVSNRLWTSLGDEIEELQDILDHSSSEEEDAPSPESSQSGSHDVSSRVSSPAAKVSVLWETYRENVAPLITIVHRPTARELFAEAARHPDGLDKNSEALIFSMYLCSIVSMKPDDCLFQFGEDRTTAVKRYRFATEQALAKAGFLNTQSLVLLQAAVLFLVCVRREDDSKFVWSMTSIVLRLAQSLGLHRDGSNFALKPFETEMRRRLWWHISLLDVRSSEDHGTDPLIHERMYDTLLPLNINDDDLSPDMEEPPKEREGCTDATFCLIRCEITSALRRANYACPGAQFRVPSSLPPIDRAGRMIQVISERCEQRYIRHCDMNIPLQWCAATVGRLILAKLWLIVHHPMIRKDRGSVFQATRESLFLTAIEVLEFGHLLETDPKTAKWGWLFRTNMQWHGVAFVLSEICVRPICPVTDRAWNAVSLIYTEWAAQGTHKKGMLWRPLAALMKRAAATRSKQQQELLSSFGPVPATTEPIPSMSHNNTLPCIHMPIGMPNSPSINPPGPTAPNILATSNDIFDAPPAQNNISAPSLPASMPYNTTMINPFLNQTPLADASQLSWEEWDQVMRDFQMDVENENIRPATGTNVAEWFA
ncbi:hypothetical protein N7519_000703 [Penicillium mononematosum]|uniref:uncharacterized protein n=1 Tax=Penicillium mononematosum TaxID=268346 RepID=UPI0025492C9E|nr:uncharacterized protein N7519_000703 [Penicillium mononematosum]KAJ6190682.1 hypothetical protein N7519_000703 [Penicillium mononematosum]